MRMVEVGNWVDAGKRRSRIGPGARQHRDKQKAVTEIRKAVPEYGIRSVVLGCGGMVDIEREAVHFPGLRLIDGVRATASFASKL